MLRTWPLLCGLALISTLIGSFGGTARAAITNMTPVIVIPGVGGSEFAANTPFRLSVDNGRGGIYTRDYGAGETVWVNSMEALALGDDDYFDALKFSADTLAHAGIDRVLDFHLSEGDRVLLDPGTTYTLSQVAADTVIDMGGGHQMILVGVQLSTLTPGWLVT